MTNYRKTRLSVVLESWQCNKYYIFRTDLLNVFDDMFISSRKIPLREKHVDTGYQLVILAFVPRATLLGYIPNLVMPQVPNKKN